ncbi:SDR family oxidoreductase [Chloroflexia bacterium SDU3-3]|nr:SDR family oxidoreductase [Chloroflexia bacterium SDU3-3]
MTTRAPIAIVTGGSRGIGKSIVEQAVQHGMDVIFTYQRSEDEANQLVASIEATGRQAAALQLEVSNIASFEAFAKQVHDILETWGAERFNFLVNNAGNGGGGMVADMSEAAFDQIMNVHVKGPVFLTQKLLPLMADGGRIINISSALSRITYPGQSAYGAAKAAIETFTRYMAAELGPRRITANVVAPGGVATDFGGIMRSPDMAKIAASVTALGRIGQPEDISGVVVSLLLPEMGWVNAQRIEASGGQNL